MRLKDATLFDVRLPLARRGLLGLGGEMPPLRIYLDTSVLGGVYDPEFEADSKNLLELFGQGEAVPVVSSVTEAEVRRAPEQVRGLLTTLLEAGSQRVALSPEAEALAAAYIGAGVVTTSYEADALHIALATLAKVDVLVSWNFRHVVNLRRIRGFNGVNLLHGYGTLEIRSPKEVRGDDKTS